MQTSLLSAHELCSKNMHRCLETILKALLLPSLSPPRGPASLILGFPAAYLLASLDHRQACILEPPMWLMPPCLCRPPPALPFLRLPCPHRGPPTLHAGPCPSKTAVFTGSWFLPCMSGNPQGLRAWCSCDHLSSVALATGTPAWPLALPNIVRGLDACSWQ